MKTGAGGRAANWEVSNASLMDHPFHLHGFFFQVIEGMEGARNRAGKYRNAAQK